jgi:predicted NAD/FAD-dependent oxidoreductase
MSTQATNPTSYSTAGATTPADVLIVGAGICGLVTATQLMARRLRVVVLDKGRGVGGRLGTRRVGPGRADHGAQFFTARDERFAALVEDWRAQNLVFRWSNGWSDGSLHSAAVSDGHPRYAVQGGMNSLPMHLAAELVRQGAILETNVKVIAATPDRTGWQVSDDRGRTWRSRSLVLTPPAVHSLALLAASGVSLPPATDSALRAIRYAPCLCALCWIEGTVWLPAPGAVQRPGADIAWIADNQRKGISPHATVLTLQGGPDWSAAYFDAPDELLLQAFNAALTEWTDGRGQIREVQFKRWRYALPTALHPQPCLRAADLPPLYFGGDAFGAPRVEGAVLSGLEIAQALAAELG